MLVVHVDGRRGGGCSACGWVAHLSSVGVWMVMWICMYLTLCMYACM